MHRLQYSIRQFIDSTRISEVVLVLTVLAAIYVIGQMTVSRYRGESANNTRIFKSSFKFCCVLVALDLVFYTAKRTLYAELWAHNGPLC